jgi:hypothetical protein
VRQVDNAAENKKAVFRRLFALLQRTLQNGGPKNQSGRFA